ncbi:hypothetical protein ACLKA7_013507 [Drosophila subpalustris]
MMECFLIPQRTVEQTIGITFEQSLLPSRHSVRRITIHSLSLGELAAKENRRTLTTSSGAAQSPLANGKADDVVDGRMERMGDEEWGNGGREQEACHIVLTEQPLCDVGQQQQQQQHFFMRILHIQLRGGFNLPNENNLGSKWQHLLLPLPLRQIE